MSDTMTSDRSPTHPTIERADSTTVERAIPLLTTQMSEHHVDLAELGDSFATAVHWLVDVAGRGAILLAYNGAHRHHAVGVAVLAYTWTIEHGGRVAWLDELFVAPEVRGCGVGTALLHRAIDVAREDGCQAIDLEVDRDHARVESLYLREGFFALPRRRFAKRLR
jgi:GNAT superfamily N-acetyltransferase